MVKCLSQVADQVLVLIDRDGVLIQNVLRPGNVIGSARQLPEVRFIDGSIEACKLLRECGFKTAIVTNQPDVSRKIISFQDAHAISNHVKHICAIDSVFICPHDAKDNCWCRKPKPGLLLEAIERYKPAHVVMIGDRITDVIAGKLVGAITVRIDASSSAVPTHYAQVNNHSDPDIVCDTLFAAVNELFDLSPVY